MTHFGESYPKSHTELYEQDFCSWIETTANLMRKLASSQLSPEEKLNYLSLLDHENLIEEIEAMGRSEKNALESNLEQLLLHLLKWRYQPSKRSNSWKYSITEHGLRILKAFKHSPSLKPYFADVFGDCYQNARLLASRETGLNKETFPMNCPFAESDILNPEYLPDDD